MDAVSRDRILRDFDALIDQRKLAGAAHDPAKIDPGEFVPAMVKSRFLIRRVPSRRTLLKRWSAVFGTAITPCALFEALSARIDEFEHRHSLLLFSRDRILYDSDIHRGDESVGELTLSFANVRDPAPGLFGSIKGSACKVVFIDHLRLMVQRAGYASMLFRSWERLFGEIGFQEFRLSASLAIGKYYWAVEGFDFLDPSEIAKRRAGLGELIRERGLEVDESELASLTHAWDFARFRRETKIPVYRDAGGFYSSRRDERFGEEVLLPLGKAFLLCSTPWEGRKPISPAVG